MAPPRRASGYGSSHSSAPTAHAGWLGELTERNRRPRPGPVISGRLSPPSCHRVRTFMDTDRGSNWAVGGAPSLPTPRCIDGWLLETPTKRRTEMGKIVISENVSLDGVIQDPAGVEGFRLGGWGGRIGGQGREEAAKVALDEALGAEALLLGRRSYEFLAARWPSRNGPLAERLNSMPKYVVSSTL